MTREDMATEVDRLERNSLIVNTFSPDKLKSIAAELRKTCATCVYFDGPDSASTIGACKVLMAIVPNDGSGYCFRWTAES